MEWYLYLVFPTVMNMTAGPIGITTYSAEQMRAIKTPTVFEMQSECDKEVNRLMKFIDITNPSSSRWVCIPLPKADNRNVSHSENRNNECHLRIVLRIVLQEDERFCRYHSLGGMWSSMGGGLDSDCVARQATRARLEQEQAGREYKQCLDRRKK